MIVPCGADKEDPSAGEGSPRTTGIKPSSFAIDIVPCCISSNVSGQQVLDALIVLSTSRRPGNLSSLPF
jgi:hypothetical protein